MQSCHLIYRQQQNGGFFMSDEFNKSGCAPSDCASCTANCESRVDEAHHTITLTMDDDTEVECAILTISL